MAALGAKATAAMLGMKAMITSTVLLQHLSMRGYPEMIGRKGEEGDAEEGGCVK